MIAPHSESILPVQGHFSSERAVAMTLPVIANETQSR
jgi:hypothetical protein